MKTKRKNPVFSRLKPAFLIACALVLFGLLTSCSKDDEPTRTDLLIGTWRMAEIDGDEVRSTLIVEITFERDGDYEEEINDNGELERYTGEWEWNSSETEITVEYDQAVSDLEVDIDRLTATEMEMDNGIFELLFVKK